MPAAPPFDPAVAAAFVARVERGARIADLLSTPGMPSQRAYAHWRRTEAGFAGEMRRLLALRYGRRSGDGHGRWRAWDEGVADRITLAVMKGAVLRRLLAGDPALPSLAVVARWRREHPEWDGALRLAMKTGRLAREREGSLARLTPELVGEISGRIIEGASLRSLAREPWTPCARTLYRWVEISREFDEEVEAACAWRALTLDDAVTEIDLANGPMLFEQTWREVRPLRLRINQLSKRPGWKRRREARTD